jgi:glutamine amidotransferase
MIIVVDYGMGNLGSIVNMFKKLGASVSIESDPDRIKVAQKIVLPGVGAFDRAMANIINRPGLKAVIEEKVLNEKTPILGVCLGMQLLTHGSEEGNLPGFGFISASASRFPRIPGMKVPHMGWNSAVPKNNSNPLLLGVGCDPRYYFVHSYAVRVDDPKHSLMRTTYGIEFDSAIGRDNVYGVQFHPEKSHKFGMQLLNNFAKL